MSEKYTVRHKNGWTGTVEKIYCVSGQCIISIRHGNELTDYAYPDAFEESVDGAVFDHADDKFMTEIRQFSLAQREKQEEIRKKRAEEEEIRAERKRQAAEKKEEQQRQTGIEEAPDAEPEFDDDLEAPRDENGVYYIGTYVPRAKRLFATDEEALSFTQELLNFKFSYTDNIADFAVMLEKWLILLTQTENVQKNIVLLAAPSSDAEKSYCPTAEAIKRACADISGSRREGSGLLPGYDVYDGTERLRRIKTIIRSSQAAANGCARPTFINHFNTISFNASGLEKLRKEGMTVVIVDDITTRGETLKGCRMRVKSTGIDSKNIKCMAFGRTMLCTAC